MNMPKEGFLESVIEIVSSIMVGKVLTDLDKRIKDYSMEFINRLMKKLLLMIAGFAIALIGLIFLFIASIVYLNEFFRSSWMGWGILGLVILIVGMIAFASSRR